MECHEIPTKQSQMYAVKTNYYLIFYQMEDGRRMEVMKQLL